MAESVTCWLQPGPPHTTITSHSGASAKLWSASTVNPPASRTGPAFAAIVTACSAGSTRWAIDTTPMVPPMSIGSTPS